MVEILKPRFYKVECERLHRVAAAIWVLATFCQYDGVPANVLKSILKRNRDQYEHNYNNNKYT